MGEKLRSLLVIGSILMMSLVLVHGEDYDHGSKDLPHVRHKRGIIWDFFQKMVITKNLIVDQYTDTRNTLNDIYNVVNEQFSDPGPQKPTSSPRITTEKNSLLSGEDTGSNSEETTTPFSISRYELGRILGRNFRGLQKLAMKEFNTALNATSYNLAEYKAEADKQFANSLAVEKKNKLKSLKG
ncbi:uncharacterized protein LOC110179064 [Drosophila serrata]|uniref:uncharacterized protein LOC110179064 n=1 Tax=Drosophila serrata TaxID=7274 RepID=UPI000A1D2C0C|nr:uncharacterized protein LOC110179064 [Drosophila serrata]